MNKISSLFFAWTAQGRMEHQLFQSRQRLHHDLSRLYPDTLKLIDIESFLDQVNAAGLVYDGALAGGVAGLYPADASWPRHSTIQMDMANWPREVKLSFWPPLSQKRPATALPVHLSKDKQAQFTCPPARLPEFLETACQMAHEAYQSNCHNISTEP